jgi:hypothetical protein
MEREAIVAGSLEGGGGGGIAKVMTAKKQDILFTAVMISRAKSKGPDCEIKSTLA